MPLPKVLTLAALTAALVGCSQGEGTAEPTPEPPEIVSTLSFVAEVEPADDAGTAVFTWSPEPAGGQRSAAVTYDIVQLAGAYVSVSVEQCATFVSADLSLTVPGDTVLPSPSFDPLDPDAGLSPREIRYGQTREDVIYPAGGRDIWYFPDQFGDRVTIRPVSRLP